MRSKYRANLIRLLACIAPAAWLVCCTLTWEGTETLIWPRTPFGGRLKHVVVQSNLIENVEPDVLEHYIKPGDTPTKEDYAAIEAELRHAELITSRLMRWTILLIGLGVLYVANYLLILILTKTSRFLSH